MLLAAGCDGVRKAIPAFRVHQRDVLDLDEATGSVAFEENVDSAALAVWHFPFESRLTTEFSNDPAGDGFDRQPVGEVGIDPYPTPSVVNKLPRPPVLPFGVSAVAEEDGPPFPLAGFH